MFGSEQREKCEENLLPDGWKQQDGAEVLLHTEGRDDVDGTRDRQPNLRRPTRIWTELGSRYGKMEMITVEDYGLSLSTKVRWKAKKISEKLNKPITREEAGYLSSSNIKKSQQKGARRKRKN